MSDESTALDQDDLPLSPAHYRRLVVESGLSHEVIRARGYETVTRENRGADYRDNGWAALLKHLPALEIPLWTTEGKSPYPQLRPDKPQIDAKGRPKKYIIPANEALRVDINPLVLERVRGAEPIIFTEGAIKADSAVSRGLCCVALLGVWGFRGRNLYGGFTALSDWQDINLKNRDVFICFDSDVTTKPEVQKALTVFRTFLASKGARPHTVFLPNGPNGEKVGLDDYFVAGHSVSDFWALAESPPDDTALPTSIKSGPSYEVNSGMMCMVQLTDDGRECTPLCNFDARIEQILEKDDGEVCEQQYVIAGVTNRGENLPHLRIKSDEFDAMGWVGAQWPGLAAIYPGKATKDHLRFALVELSKGDTSIPRKTEYTHTGWRRDGDRWVYLSGSGALRDNGEIDPTYHVAPDVTLERIMLPQVDREKIIAGLRADLELLSISKPEFIVPQLALAYLAPLCEVYRPPFMMHVVGRTGSFKTEVASLIQAHFGQQFEPTTLPGSWSSTANFMQRQAYLAKDALIVMDDFKPPLGARKSYHQKAETFIRDFANGTGRGRLREDTSARKTFVGRGVVLSTGEDLPEGESIRARIVALEVSRGTFDAEVLTRCQQMRDRYAFAMSGYVAWIADQIDTLEADLSQRHDAAVGRFRATQTDVPRAPYNVSHLYVGFDQFLRYCVHMGVLTEKERQAWLAKAFDAMQVLMAGADDQARSENPTLRGLETVREALLAQTAHLRSTKGLGYEPGLECFGWKRDGGEARPGGLFIGWVDLEKRRVYLYPDAMYSFVLDHAPSDSRSMFTRRRWQAEMTESGIAVEMRIRTNGAMHRVFDMTKFFPAMVEQLTGIQGEAESEDY